MKKRGTHVGFVLSFIIFITTLVFLFTLLQPGLKTDSSKKILLNSLENELNSYLSGNLTTAMVLITQPGYAQSCIYFKGLLGQLGVGTQLEVIGNASESFTPYTSSDSQDLFIDKTSNIASTLFLIVYSNSFPALPLYPKSYNSCGASHNNGNGINYTAGLVRTDSVIFESKVLAALGNYSTNYSQLKDSLKVPSDTNFGFTFTYSNGTSIGTSTQNQTSLNVYAIKEPVSYVDSTGNQSLGFLNIEIW